MASVAVALGFVFAAGVAVGVVLGANRRRVATPAPKGDAEHVVERVLAAGPDSMGPILRAHYLTLYPHLSLDEDFGCEAVFLDAMDRLLAPHGITSRQVEEAFYTGTSLAELSPAVARS